MRAGLVGDYLELGLRLGRHVDGLVDAYYGPPGLATRVAAEPVTPPGQLVSAGRTLVAGLDAGEPLDPDEAWVAAQRSDPPAAVRAPAG
ncbi:MAG: DUF885 domain-containing protein, partial [Acidimicrobiales bacterium]